MDSSRPHDPRRDAGAQRVSSYPYDTQRPPQQRAPQPRPQRTSSSIYPYETQRAPQQPQQVAPPPPLPQQRRRVPVGRRVLGVLAFVVLTALSIPLHILTVFFVFVEFESPGDAVTAALLVSGAFVGSFAALFVTGLVTQLVGAFPGRWRARVTFAALSGAIALGIAYAAALTQF